jgi:methionyl-tRNA formyltransferase
VPLRIVFCGTPAFALPALRQLIAQPDFQVEGVVTQPDRARGRGQSVASSPVKEAALEAGIGVYQPERIRSESAHDYFRRTAPDVVVVIAYGQIIPASLIAIPRLGWINLHASLLPKYRGAAPIHWAIASGETRTGLTTMQINAGLDTGPMLMKHEVKIEPDETSPELAARLAEEGAPLVVETLRGLERGDLEPIAQDNSQATFAPPLKKEDGQIDWSLPAQKIYDRVRGLQPWPGAFTSFRGQRSVIWGKPARTETNFADASAGARAGSGPAPATTASVDAGTLIVNGDELLVACGNETALQLESVQIEGRKRVTARDFANGARLSAGDRFQN